MNGTAASGRPFNRNLVAANDADIQIALQRKGLDQLPAALADLAKRPERARSFAAEFLGEFPACRRFRDFAVTQFSFRNRPCAKVAVAPKRAARMHKENDETGVAMAVHQDAGACRDHAICLEARK
jgi:site-specific recombinase XerC